jgi:hypothetical protein
MHKDLNRRELLTLSAASVAGLATAEAGPQTLAAAPDKPLGNGLQQLQSAMDSLWIIDSHEHFGTEQETLRRDCDLLKDLICHEDVQADLVSSGMAPEDVEFALNVQFPLSARWAKFAPFWQRIKHAGYSKNLPIALRDLFGIEDVNDRTYELLSTKFKEATKPGRFRYVLKDKAHIDLAILDTPLSFDPNLINIDGEFFLRSERFDDVITVNPASLSSLEKSYNTSLRTLDDLLTALDAGFRRAVEAQHAAGVKCALAYKRILRFEDVPQAQAERLFNRMIQTRVERWDDETTVKPSSLLSAEDAKALQDFLMHRVIQCAIQYDLTVAFHTGIQYGNNNDPTNSRPTHLINLFAQYPRARFLLFHGSYPYMGELGVLAKMFPNVYIDMNEMHAFPYEAFKRSLREWLDIVPSNKIIAYGGDGHSVECTYATSRLVRRFVTEVLAEKVGAGSYTEEEAVALGTQLLRDNALAIYKLQKVGNRYVHKG